MALRNPIRKLGSRARGTTPIPRWLIRTGVKELGCDAYAVMTLLLSHDDGWETSAVAISQQFGWGENRNRALKALHRLKNARLLAIQDYVYPGGGRSYQEYIFYADARRLTEAEVEKYAMPVILAPKGGAW